MRITSLRKVSCGVILLCFHQLVYAECNINIRVGSGGSAGMYHKFVNSWSEFAKDNSICIEEVQSNGSIDNLELMKEGKVDYAIIQSDIGYHAYYGVRGYEQYNDFAGIKSLYKEYIQIVYSNKLGELKSFSGLQGKTIAVDSIGSASYWNARDLLEAAGMIEGFDFNFVSEDMHSVELLQKGSADVAFYTSAKVHPIVQNDEGNNFSFLSLPVRASKRLSVEMKNPYYDHGILSFERNGSLINVSSVAVQAFLVGVNSRKGDEVKKVNQSIDDFLDYQKNLQTSELDIEYIEGEIQDYPFKMHYLTTESWQSKIVAQLSRLKLTWLFPLLSIAAVLSVVFGVFVLRGRKYTSAGLIKNESYFYRLRYRFINFSHYAIGFALWILWVWVVATIIVFQENKFTDARGMESPLDGFGFVDRTVWLIKSSFTTLPSEVPLSPIASILIPMTVLFGLGAFLYPAYLMLSAHQKRSAKRSKGDWDYKKMRNHTIICGWNDRTTGVIYSILSEFAPRAKKVILVAETDSETPLDDNYLDKRRVFFVRGDPSDISVLMRAGAENASEAIIMASENMGSKNVSGILTAVALRKLADLKRTSSDNNFFIGAELIHTENLNAFYKAGASSIVNTIQLADNMAALSLVSIGLSDFILDCMTYDNYFEIYAELVSNLPNDLLQEIQIEQKESINSNKKVEHRYDLNPLRQAFVSNDIQLLGASQNNNNDDMATSFSFLNHPEVADSVTDADKIIFFSEDKNILKDRVWGNALLEQKALPELSFERKTKKVLIIGDLTRSKRIESLLADKYETVLSINTQSVLDSISQNDNDFEIMLDSDMTAILILVGSNKPDLNRDNINSHLSLDMISILIIKYLNDLKRNNGYKYKVITETHDIESRDILDMAGADDVLLKNALIERVLSKMVFNHGEMYEIISHMMTLNDGVYLYSYDVNAESPFIGMPIKELFFGKSDNYQICGWWSSQLKDYLRKNIMGTPHHFVTATNSRFMKKAINENSYVEVGDELVLVRFDKNN